MTRVQFSPASSRPTNLRMAGPPSTSLGRPPATRGTASTSPAARRAARARRWRRALCPRRSAPTPAARSAARPRLCGIVGLKPTYGLVSRSGVYANSFSFDHAGPMTWTVEDCAIVLQAIAGHDPKDPASATRPVPDYRAALTGDIKGLRIGIVRHLHEQDCAVTPEVGAALERSLRCSAVARRDSRRGAAAAGARLL